MNITVKPAPVSGYRIMVEDGMMAAMPAGPRLFRAPPIPDIKFTHALLPDAERDAATLRSYIARTHGIKQTDKELRKAGA